MSIHLTDPLGPNPLHVGLGKTNETLRQLTAFSPKTSSSPGRKRQLERRGIVFVSTREEIEKSDIRRLIALGNPRQPVSAIKAVRGRIIFTVSGYDDVSDEVFEIEEVRRFYAHAHAVWPSWLYTAHLRSPSFYAVVLSLLPHLTIIRDKEGDHWRTRICQHEVEQFFQTSLRPAAILHHRAKISRQRGLQHLKSVAAYLGMPGA